MHDDPLFTLAAILVLGVGAQWLSWRLRQPAILALLTLGILAGPATGLLRPDELFGDLLFPLISLGVALVLFEGGLTLKFDDLRGHGLAVTHLVSWGAILNWLLIAAGCHFLAGMPAATATLLAALMVVTGPTVTNPLLRTMRAKPAVSHILRWEGILIDPVGALLAVLVFQFLVPGGGNISVFLGGVAAGLGCGAAGALGLGQVLARQWVPDYLQNVVTLAAVVLVFAGSEALAHESGLLAVTLMGVTLANLRSVDVREILSFKESLSVIIISILFIVLGARVDPAEILATGAQGVIVLLVVLAARPFVVAASTFGLGYSWQQKALLGWVAPRGIVAAAVSSLFAVRLEAEGIAGAELLVPLSFLVIIATVLLQSLTARPLTRLLGLSEGRADGVLIVGANPVARAVAEALQREGFRTKLADTARDAIRSARMAGLETYLGDPVSAHAEQYLERSGIGRLLALSPSSRWNLLCCLRYRDEFGAGCVFRLRSSDENEESLRAQLAGDLKVPYLFPGAITYGQFAGKLARGGEIKRLSVTENFSLEGYRAQSGNEILPLFLIEEERGTTVFGSDSELEFRPGQRLLALVWRHAEPEGE